MLTSASSSIIGPETHPDGDSGRGSGAVTSPGGGLHTVGYFATFLSADSFSSALLVGL